MRRPWFATIACMTGLGLIIQAKNAHGKHADILYEKDRSPKKNGSRLKSILILWNYQRLPLWTGGRRPALPSLITCNL
jgi:hypothetical protein